MMKTTDAREGDELGLPVASIRSGAIRGGDEGCWGTLSKRVDSMDNT
jgi:hypothetical protein